MSGNTYHGAINGDAAGRDVVKHIYMAPELTESELQAKFQRDTGIHCNRPARAQLETLLEHHGFTVKKLQQAWRMNSMVWSKEDGRLKATSGGIDMFIGWAGMIGLTLMFVVVSSFVFTHPDAGWWKAIYSVVGMISFMTAARYLLLSTIWPQSVARRAEKAIQKEGVT